MQRVRMEVAKLSQLFGRVTNATATLNQGFLHVHKESDKATDVSARAASVQLVWSQKDLINDAMLKYMTHSQVTANQVTHGAFPCPWDVQVVSISPSRKYMATVKVDKGDDAEATFAVYSEGHLIATFRPTKAQHGVIYSGEREGGLAWSHDERRFAYIAEKKVPEAKSYWPNVNIKDKDKDDKQTQDVGKKFDYEEDWGEQYTGKKTGMIFVATIETGKIHEVKGIPDDVTCSEVNWTPQDDGLVFTALATNEPRRLGLVYCFNRPSSLYHVVLPTTEQGQESNAEEAPKATKLLLKWTDNSSSAKALVEGAFRSASFAPSGDKFVFLAARQNVVTHNTCSALCVTKWPSLETSVVIDIVDSPPEGYSTTNAATAFTGMYSGALGADCWAKDSKRLFVNCQMGSRVLWKMVDVDNKRIVSPSYVEPQQLACETLLDHQDDCFLVKVMSPSRPPSVFFCQADPGTLEHTNKPVEVENAALSSGSSTWSPLVEDWKIVSVPVPTKPLKEDRPELPVDNLPLLAQVTSDAPYEATVLVPKGEIPAEGFPLLVDIHGGPHGNSPAMFNILYNFFAALGYSVMTVNYRGSVGFGIRPLESLVGRVGAQDVDDVQHAVHHVLDNAQQLGLPRFDKTRVAVSGGSHGGFLGAHLVAQFPEFYRCCVLRNPVTNISSQFFTSDIPDWGLAVVGVDAFESIKTRNDSTEPSKLSPQQRLAILQRLWLMSPMANDLSKVKSPLLLGIGGKDRRVPMTEGLQFRDSLKATGVQTKVRFYPDDCHPLDSVQASSDFAVNWALWMQKFLE